MKQNRKPWRHNFGKRRTQGGWVLITFVIVVVVIAALTFPIIGTLMMKEMIRGQQMYNENLVRNLSNKAREPGGVSMIAHAHFLSNILQAQFNKKAAKGGFEDQVALDAIFAPKFPMFFPMEMRGATLVDKNDGLPNDPVWNDYRRVYATGIMEVAYNGIIPISRVPGNTLDPGEYPWAAHLTYTLSYTTELFAVKLPEDGSHPDLGGIWRFSRPVSTWSGTKGGGEPDPDTPPDPAPTQTRPKVQARYENATELHVYVALAKLEDSEPFAGDLPGLAEPPSACDPSEPLQVIHDPDGSCRVGNCGTYLAHNFQNCSDDPNQAGSPAKFLAEYNSGQLNSRDVEKWIRAGVQVIHDAGLDRIGPKLVRDRFTPTLIGQVPQTVIPAGSNLLKTQLLVEKPNPLQPQHWTY